MKNKWEIELKEGKTRFKTKIHTLSKKDADLIIEYSDYDYSTGLVRRIRNK